MKCSNNVFLVPLNPQSKENQKKKKIEFKEAKTITFYFFVGKNFISEEIHQIQKLNIL